MRGTRSVFAGPSGPTPNFDDLKKRLRSSFVTLSKSGVRPSYICVCRSAPAGTGTAPGWLDGTMFSAVSA